MQMNGGKAAAGGEGRGDAGVELVADLAGGGHGDGGGGAFLFLN